MNVLPLRPKSVVSRSRSPESSAVVAALDVGSTKVCCVIGEVKPNKHKASDGEEQHVRVIGIGHHASRGVYSGAVVNLEEAERAIRVAVDAAERMAGTTLSEVYVNLSGGRPACTSHTAAMRIPGPAVTAADIRTVASAAMRGVDSGKRIVLHATPVKFDLDEAKGIKDPEGMYGERLSVEVNAITVSPGPARNLALAVERCHLGLAGIAIAPYAAARAVLVEDELSLGVTVVEMGGSTTSIAVFLDGHLISSEVVPVGGHHITKDLAAGLSTSIAHAERLKTLYGSALSSVWDEREMITIPLLGERGANETQKVPRSMLSGIIRPRLEEILELVKKRLDGCQAAERATRQVVLSGGASQLTGMREFASQMLGRSVRLGSPRPIPGMPESATGPAFAVAAGLLRYALKPDVSLLSLPQIDRRLRSQNNYLVRVGQWLRESF
jgi:cell division protein FtsA